jgi:hypothetical protein
MFKSIFNLLNNQDESDFPTFKFKEGDQVTYDVDGVKDNGTIVSTYSVLGKDFICNRYLIKNSLNLEIDVLESHINI